MKDREQVTTINSNNSSKVNVGSHSVAQGSILSGLLATLFSLYMHLVPHNIIHNTNNEYFNCPCPKSVVFVDDIYTIIQT